MRALRLPITLLVAALCAAVPLSQESLRDSYGFIDFEIYEFENGIFGLTSGDVDGDGLSDLALVNNARSRIEVLLRLPADADDVPDPDLRYWEANAVRYDGRFQRRSHAVERRVLRMTMGDFDADGKADLAYVSDGGRLSYVLQVADSPKEVTREVDEVRSVCDVMRVADVDSDGVEDLVLAGQDSLVWIRSMGNGEFGATERLDYLTDRIDDVRLTDLDGDGTQDLLLIHLGQDRPLRYRLREAKKGLGPRLDAEVPQLRSATVTDWDGDGRAEVLGVFKLSGRLACFSAREEDDEKPRLTQYSFRKSESKGRSERTFGSGDLNSDGALDLVVANAQDASVSLFLGRPGQRALERVDSSSFVGVSGPRIGDVTGDGEPELVVVSGPERMIGVARPDAHGRLPFPASRPVEGEPTAVDVADMDGDGIGDVVLVATTGEGRKRSYELQIWPGGADGISADPSVRRKLEGLRKVPQDVRAFDLDRDGKRDLMVFLAGDTEVPMILMQRSGEFVADERKGEIPGLGVLEGASASSLSYVDCDHDGSSELFVASNNFARTLLFAMGEEGELAPRVLEQINGPLPDSKITACTTGDLLKSSGEELVLLDARKGELVLYGRLPSGTAEVRERIDAGRLGSRGLLRGDFDADGRIDVAVLGDDGFGILFAADDGMRLTEVASYEPTRSNVWLDRMAVGDLNGDGEPDLALTELGEHAIVLLAADFPRFQRALGFRVFEAKTFTSGSEGREPREILAADLNGDDKDDLAILVHDKLLLYLQE